LGGLGTLDELTDIIELKRQKHHDKPIIILNTNNYYEGLIMQFEKMEKDGFNTFSMDDYVRFVDTPEEAIEYLNKYIK
jgi:predicted Rossmann-fold nucleotide-binding protein